jgi:hypothetical protein
MQTTKRTKTYGTTEDAVLSGLRQGPLTVSQLIECGAAFVNAAAALTKRQGSPVKFERGAYRLEGSN